MADLNSFNGTGRLGKDVEIRQAGESKVVNFSIAIDGHKKDDTTWLTCVAWNKQAEFLSNYAQKGSHVRVSGRIQVREHNDKYYTEVVCYEVQILNGWKDRDHQQPSNQQNNQQGGYQQQGVEQRYEQVKNQNLNNLKQDMYHGDDDIPF